MMNGVIRHIPVAALAAALLAPAASRGQSPPATTQPATQPAAEENANDWSGTVSPAKAEDALPGGGADFFAYTQDGLDLEPGNAATLYATAFAELPYGDLMDVERFDKLLFDTPVGDLDAAAATEVLRASERAFAVLEPAVRRARCDFDTPLHEEGIRTFLPYLNHARWAASNLQLLARTRAVQGRFGESGDALRRVVVMGLQIGNMPEPFYVDGLIGVGLVAQAAREHQRVSVLPGAPNRYWALTNLPRPAFDATRWMRTERSMLDWTFPAIRTPDLMDATRLREIADLMVEWNTYDDQKRAQAEAVLAALSDPDPAGPFAAEARHFLKARGVTDASLDAMGLYPMLARYLGQDFKREMDRRIKVLRLPYQEADARLAAIEADGAKTSPLTRLLLQDTGRRGLGSVARLTRLIDALRIVEAVRDYAADHGGLPPAALGDCRLPVPDDCITGKAFEYAVDGRTFTLNAPPQDGKTYNGFTWTVTLRSDEP